jgi:hypothetical protein
MAKGKNIGLLTGIYLVLYLIHYAVFYVADDIWFAAVQNTPYIEWITSRYYGWSGRLFADSTLYFLMYNKAWIWRLLNPFLFMALAFGITRIIKKDFTLREFLIALFTLGFLSQPVLSSAFFWITGSINYLWPIALGLFAMIPYADRIFRRELALTKTRFIITIISAFLASIGNEQVALCMCAFAVVSHVSLIFRQEKQDRRLLILTVVILSGASILLFAPGNRVRWAAESKQWYPGFELLTFKQHLHVGFMWMFDKLFTMMKNLIYVLAFVTLFAANKDAELRKRWYFKLLAVFTCLGFFSSLAIGQDVGWLYNFNSLKSYSLGGFLHLSGINKGMLLALVPYLFWTSFCLLLAYLVIKKGENKVFLTLCLLATLSALVVLFFSPTIFASGDRVLAVSSVLLSILVVYTILKNNLLQGYLAFILFAGLPVANFVIFFSNWFLKGYSVLF